MPASRSDLFDLYETHGGDRYGEDVTQVQHALQCALQAEQAAASPALIIAALLHDVGHLLHKDAGAAIAAGVDDRHEALGAKTLAKVFGPEIVEPVALHVAAKRYLCHADPGYWQVLSEASKTTLVLQGGPMRKAEAMAFIARPFAEEAVRLRRWDEAAKRPDLKTPDLTHYRSIAARCLPDA